MEIHICLIIYWQLALKIPNIESDFKVNIDIVIKLRVLLTVIIRSVFNIFNA